MISSTHRSYQSLIDLKIEMASSKRLKPLSSKENSSYYELILCDPLVPSRREELAFLRIKVEQLPKNPSLNAERFRSLMTRHQVKVAHHLSYVHSIRPM